MWIHIACCAVGDGRQILPTPTQQLSASRLALALALALHDSSLRSSDRGLRIASASQNYTSCWFARPQSVGEAKHHASRYSWIWKKQSPTILRATRDSLAYLQLLQIYSLTYSSTLKMEALCSPETLTWFRNTQHDNPEDASFKSTSVWETTARISVGTENILFPTARPDRLWGQQSPQRVDTGGSFPKVTSFGARGWLPVFIHYRGI
jgi:hypothetical protein